MNTGPPYGPHLQDRVRVCRVQGALDHATPQALAQVERNDQAEVVGARAVADETMR